MIELLSLAVGVLVGFVASRTVRRPQHAARAASVARTVEGSMGGRRHLDAPELQRACFSEMVRHVRTGAAGTRHAPREYLLRVHPDDLATIDEARTWFLDGLRDAFVDEAAEQGWLIAGGGADLDIQLEADQRSRRGVPRALAVESAQTASRQPSPPPAASSAAPPRRPRPPGTEPRLRLLADTGATCRVEGPEVAIGRAEACALVIDDRRVSRRHAVLTKDRDGWRVADAGSANGTTLDGRRLGAGESQPVRAGSVIGVGPLDVRVLDDAGPGAQP